MANKKSPSTETLQNNTKSPDLAVKKAADAKVTTVSASKQSEVNKPTTPSVTATNKETKPPALPAATTGDEKTSTPSNKSKSPADSEHMAGPTSTVEAKHGNYPAEPIQTAPLVKIDLPAQPPVVKPLAKDKPALPDEQRPLPSEVDFVAGLAPLPTDTNEDEITKRELLRDVEAQFELFLGANEAIEDTVAAPLPESESNVEPAVEPSRDNTTESESVNEYYHAPEPEHRYEGPSIPHLSIIQISPELSPVAKVGGLADVVYGLSNELEIRGNSVEIILPKYDCLRYDHIWGLWRLVYFNAQATF